MDDLIVSPCSDPNLRPENQDAFGHFDTPYGPLFLVADGTGGPAKGKIAAEYLVRRFPEHLRSCHARGMGAAEALSAAFRTVNRGLIERAKRSPELEGMATTVVLALETADGFLIGHVGDSRAYRYTPDGFQPLTLDHSEVAEQYAKGLIGRHESRNHPKAHIIYKAAGSAPDIRLDLRRDPIALAPGEGLLLCSDGLTGQVSDEAIFDRIRQAERPETVAQTLVRLAKEHGATDNITVIYLQRPRFEPQPIPEVRQSLEEVRQPVSVPASGVPIPTRASSRAIGERAPFSLKAVLLLAALFLMGCALSLFHFRQLFSISRLPAEPVAKASGPERGAEPGARAEADDGIEAEITDGVLTDIDRPEHYEWPYRDCRSGLAETSKTLLGGLERSLAGQAPIDHQKEMELGQKLADQFLKKYPGRVNRDKTWTDYLDRVGQSLTAKCQRPDIGYTFTLIEDDQENALALPGGQIMVFRGLLDRQIENEAQLAFVLAHEMIHVDRRHTLSLLELIDPLGLPDDAAILLKSYLRLPFSMTQEEEADRLALDLIRGLGYSPYQAVYLVQRMGADDPPPPKEGLISGVLGELEDLLATHPDGERRTCLLKNQVAGIPDSEIPNQYYVGLANYQNQIAMIDERF